MVRNISLEMGPRLILGVVFLIAAISKLPIQEEWIELIIAYKILPRSLATCYALALPYLEFAVGLFLIIGLFIKFWSLLSIVMIISFIAANLLALSTEPNGGCYCFGKLVTMPHEVAIIVDILLLLAALYTYSRRNHRFSLESWVKSLIRNSKIVKRV